MTNAEIYRAAIKADEAFHAQLVRVFGKKKAGDARYNQSLWPPNDRKLKAAYLRFRRTGDRWMKVMKTHHVVTK